MKGSVEQLGTEIVRGAGDLEAALCHWLGLVAEFDRRGGWAEEGCQNCAAWVSWRCGLSLVAARDRVRVARRLQELPLVRASFARGELTYSKVRALTRIGDVSREEDLVGLARHATAAQLDRMVGAYTGVVRTEAGAERVHADRTVSWHHDEDGCLVLRAKLPAEQGSVLVKAIESARDELLGHAPAEARGSHAPAGAREPEQAEREPVAARNADALVAVADSALAAREATRPGGDRFQVVVHVDLDTLAGRGDAAGALEHGPALPAETLRRLGCDAAVVGLIERDGKTLSVGRKTRSIPPAIRRALQHRDRGCQFPGCTHQRHVDAHHIHHWAQGGSTNVANLVLLCRHHHRLLHEGGFTLSGRPGRLLFRRPDGRPLRQVRARREAPCPLPSRAPAGAPIQIGYEPMDLGYAVDALLDFAPSGIAGGRLGGDGAPPG